MSEIDEKEEGYPFGVYFCTKCRTLIMWYPDIKKYPNMNHYPEQIQCPNCKNFIKPTEKLVIIDYMTELVPKFLEITNKYDFSVALIIDEEHVHFSWTRSQVQRQN